MQFPRTMFVAALATSFLFPASAIAQDAFDQTPTVKSAPAGKPASKRTAKKPKKYVWRGYGFLPGYRQPPALTDWRDRRGRFTGNYDRYGRELRFVRYYGWSDYGQLQYGWGGPGIYRGQWNGGSFGPCWTNTPIGMIWNCGK